LSNYRYYEVPLPKYHRLNEHVVLILVWSYEVACVVRMASYDLVKCMKPD